jgi:hypothetical protein
MDNLSAITQGLIWTWKSQGLINCKLIVERILAFNQVHILESKEMEKKRWQVKSH